MRAWLTLMLLSLFLSGCQQQGREGDFYVYSDAQGNLVTMQRGASAAAEDNAAAEKAVAKNGQQEPDKPAAAAPALSEAEMEAVEESRFRPSEEVDAELEARERDRFFTYVDERGQLVTQPVDIVAAKQAREAAPPDYQPAGAPPHLETYRAIRADCCLALPERAQSLARGKQLSLLFSRQTVTLDETPFAAVVIKPEADVSEVELTAYIRRNGYLAAQVLWLDEEGVPALLVDQPFERRYRETWLRHGYLQGTVPREPGLSYMVLFLPYHGEAPSTDGLTAVSRGELVVSGK